MIKDFKGKVAVITGAASGIGYGFSLAFAKRGMNLVLVDVDKENLEKVAQEIIEIGVDVMTMVTDVSDHEQVAQLADASYERFGNVNILCNNAGVGKGGPISLLTPEDWEWVLGVNLNGVIYGTRNFLSRMLKSKELCHIVNTASIEGLITGGSGPYTASKYAVVAFSERLIQECFNTNVGVSVLCPAHVDTNIVPNAGILSQNRPGLWKPTPEMIKFGEVYRENFEKMLKLGMAPETVGEKVIKAIENDIFYIITHPDFVPYIQARFERIYDDSLRLNEEIEVETEVKTKSYRHKSPAFSISYPESYTELKPDPMTTQVFTANRPARGNIEIHVSNVSEEKQLDTLPRKLVKRLKSFAKEIKITSDKQVNLRDGMPANECILEYKVMGIVKVKCIHLSVF